MIEALTDLTEQNDVTKPNPELQAYLVSIKEECEKNGYAGFTFVKGDKFCGKDS